MSIPTTTAEGAGAATHGAAEKTMEALEEVARALGLPQGEGRSAPMIVLPMVISALARRLGGEMAGKPIFLDSGNIVTVSPRGQKRPMESIRFCTWVEQYVSFVRPGTKEGFRPESISAETAAKVLASDEFREGLRELKGVSQVKLPAWKNAEKTELRLLPEGYDEETGIFTLNSLPFDEHMDVDDAYDFLKETYQDFPFAEEGEVHHRRSFAVQIASHVSVFGRHLLLDGARPLIPYLANQPGSGKSLLSKMALAPVYGAVQVQSYPGKEDEQDKLLTALAYEQAPYVLFDNAKGRLSSAPLEKFITAPCVTGRVLGKTQTISMANGAQIFITGNGLTLSPDLVRRSIPVVLFCRTEATQRKFSKLITEAWLVRPEIRAKFLSALWSILRHWESKGCLRSEGVILPTFEDFSAVIGGIVTSVGFEDPMAPAELVLDERGDACRRLIASLADSVEDDEGTRRFVLAEIIQRAQDLEIHDLLLGSARDPNKTFGHRLKPFVGREFIDTRGRGFEFGVRQRDSAAVGYPITILKK